MTARISPLEIPINKSKTFGALTIETWQGGYGLYAADTDGQIFESLGTKIVEVVPHGDTPDLVRNNPALKGLDIPKTGQQGIVGLVQHLVGGRARARQ